MINMYITYIHIYRSLEKICYYRPASYNSIHESNKCLEARLKAAEMQTLRAFSTVSFPRFVAHDARKPPATNVRNVRVAPLWRWAGLRNALARRLSSPASKREMRRAKPGRPGFLWRWEEIENSKRSRNHFLIQYHSNFELEMCNCSAQPHLYLQHFVTLIMAMVCLQLAQICEPKHSPRDSANCLFVWLQKCYCLKLTSFDRGLH